VYTHTLEYASSYYCALGDKPFLMVLLQLLRQEFLLENSCVASVYTHTLEVASSY
jgi:hypothetical protein